MSSIQQQEQTMNDLRNHKPSFVPFYVLSIGGDQYDYSVNHEQELCEHIKNIYENINDYKGDKIEVWWEMGGDDYEPITIIQECKNCNEDYCCCSEEELQEYYENQQEEEQTLNCETCKIDIIRDSEEHNNCIIDDTGEKIYCRNCVEEEIRNIDTVD